VCVVCVREGNYYTLLHPIPEGKKGNLKFILKICTHKNENIILIFIQHKETGHLSFIMANGGDNGARRWRALEE